MCKCCAVVVDVVVVVNGAVVNGVVTTVSCVSVVQLLSMLL